MHFWHSCNTDKRIFASVTLATTLKPQAESYTLPSLFHNHIISLITSTGILGSEGDCVLNRCTDRMLQREELQREVGFYLCHQLTSLHPVRLQARRGGDPVVGKRLPGSMVQRAEGQLCPGAASRHEQEHLGLNMSQKRAQMFRKASGLAHQKEFLHGKSIKHKNRLPREAVRSPALEALKRCGDMALRCMDRA